LAELERQLARIVGPLAKVLVRNAAANAADRHGLYGLLAEHLNSPEERRRFLAGEPGVTVDPSATLPPVPEAAAAVVAAAPAVVPGGRPLTPDMLVRATQLLAKYLGPVASVMIKKAAQTAADESHLYSMLADKLADPAQRQRFPREAEGGQSAAQLCAKPG
jgi:serine/threonine-protein kinase